MSLLMSLKIWWLERKLSALQAAVDKLDAEVKALACANDADATFQLAWRWAERERLSFRLGYLVGELGALRARARS